MTNQTDPNAEKNPNDWVTGDEAATGPQKSYIETLGQQTGEHVDVDDLNKADASRKIEALQQEKKDSDTDHPSDVNDIAADTDPDLSNDESA